MPKLPECDRCLLYAHNPYLVCVVHPSGAEGDRCMDFRLDSTAEAEKLWEPVGASYYNGELIVQLLSNGTSYSSWNYWIGIRCLRGAVLSVKERSRKWSHIRCIGIVQLAGGWMTQFRGEAIANKEHGAAPLRISEANVVYEYFSVSQK